MPCPFPKLPLGRDEGFERMKRFCLDAADIRILTAVQQHGQLSKSKLAELVNISPTPCWVRLEKLKTAGLIRRYRAEIALEKVFDFTQVIVTVSLTHHRKADFDRFEAYVNQQDEIVECIATGGGMDYVLKAISPTLTAFQTLMDTMVSAEVGVDRYLTYFATRTVKSGLPNLSKLAANARRQIERPEQSA